MHNLASIMSVNVSDTIALLKRASTADDIDAALKCVTSSSLSGSSAVLLEFKSLLESFLSETWSLNAKVRRKVKRMLDMINSDSSSASITAPAMTANLNTAPSASSCVLPTESTKATAVRSICSESLQIDKSLNTIISAVQGSKSSMELDQAIAEVHPGIGSCHSRRKLKRAIEAATKSPDIESSMNAKIRRRISRVLKALSPGNVPVQQMHDPASGASVSGAIPESGVDDASGVSRKRRRVIPYIVFFGQLPFDVTEADLVDHISSNCSASTEGLRIRLLTDPVSGNSKGTAFVETDNAGDMHALLHLHHSFLRGRRMNVELSCGGKNKSSRIEKLQLKREELGSKFRNKAEEVLNDFSAKGVINISKIGERFREKLLNCSVPRLKAALEKFSSLDSSQRSLSALDRLVDTV